MTLSIPLLVAAATIAAAGVWLTVIAVRRQVVLAGVTGVMGAALLALGQALESLLEDPQVDGASDADRDGPQPPPTPRDE